MQNWNLKTLKGQIYRSPISFGMFSVRECRRHRRSDGSVHRGIGHDPVRVLLLLLRFPHPPSQRCFQEQLHRGDRKGTIFPLSSTALHFLKIFMFYIMIRKFENSFNVTWEFFAANCLSNFFDYFVRTGEKLERSLMLSLAKIV